MNTGYQLSRRRGGKDEWVTKSDLIARLERGWDSRDNSLAEDFARQWGGAIGGAVAVEEVDKDIVRFRAQLDHVRLAGMGRVPGLLVGGDGASGLPALRQLWRSAGADYLIAQALCATTEAHETARLHTPRDISIVLSPREFAHVVAPSGGIEALKQILRAQIDRLRLIPYSVSSPAEGAMFFGRDRELQQLLSGKDTLVVVGPSFIGKTSLLKRAAQASGLDSVYHSFRQVTPSTMDECARAIAMAVHECRQADRVGTQDLAGFLHYSQKVRGGRVTLILDGLDHTLEADRAYGYPLLDALRAASQRGSIRLVLGGRTTLQEISSDEKMPLRERMTVLQLGPLPEDAARDLILLPCQDQGFEIVNRDEVHGHVCEMTGRLPHLLQYYGAELSKIAAARNARAISMEEVKAFEARHETATYFAGQLRYVHHPKQRLVALLLLREHPRIWMVPEIQSLAAQESLSMTLDETNEVCDELVMHNVLMWEGGGFRVANQALRWFLDQRGLLDALLVESEAWISENASPTWPSPSAAHQSAAR